MREKQFIERGELINRFEENLKYQEDNKHWEVARGTRVAINAIRNLPAADVVEVKHGEWLPIVIQESYFDPPYCDTCKCSICGYEIDVSETVYNYCPNCGAKMNGKDNNVTTKIDIVEVVRCQYCQYGRPIDITKSPEKYYRDDCIVCECEDVVGEEPMIYQPDHFCRCGKRREEE